MSRQCAHKFTSANYTAAIRSQEPIKEPDPYLNHGCQNCFTHRMPEEIYAGHSMLLISLFHWSGRSVGTRANALPGPILCVCLEENVVLGQKMAKHHLLKSAVKMISTKHQQSHEHWKWCVFSWLIPVSIFDALQSFSSHLIFPCPSKIISCVNWLLWFLTS